MSCTNSAVATTMTGIECWNCAGRLNCANPSARRKLNPFDMTELDEVEPHVHTDAHSTEVEWEPEEF